MIKTLELALTDGFSMYSRVWLVGRLALPMVGVNSVCCMSSAVCSDEDEEATAEVEAIPAVAKSPLSVAIVSLPRTAPVACNSWVTTLSAIKLPVKEIEPSGVMTIF